MDPRLHIPLLTVPPQYQPQNNQMFQQSQQQYPQQPQQFQHLSQFQQTQSSQQYAQQHQKYNLVVFPNQSHHLAFHSGYFQGNDQAGVSSYPPYSISTHSSQPMNSPAGQIFTPSFSYSNAPIMTRVVIPFQMQNQQQNVNGNWFASGSAAENTTKNSADDGTARFQENNNNNSNIENQLNFFAGGNNNNINNNNSHKFASFNNHSSSFGTTNNQIFANSPQGNSSGGCLPSKLQGSRNNLQGNLENIAGTLSSSTSAQPQNNPRRRSQGKNKKNHQDNTPIQQGDANDRETPSPVLLVMVFELREHEATNDLIQSVFVKYGFVNKVLIFKRSPEQTQAFIEMDSIEAALTAKKALNKTKIKLFPNVSKQFKIKVHFSSTPHLNLCNYKTEGADYRERTTLNAGKPQESRYLEEDIVTEDVSNSIHKDLLLQEESTENTPNLNEILASNENLLPRMNYSFAQKNTTSLINSHLGPIQPPPPLVSAISYLSKQVLSSDDECASSSDNNSKDHNNSSCQLSPNIHNLARPREVSIFCCDDKIQRDFAAGNQRLINNNHPINYLNQEASTKLLHTKLESCESLNQIQEQFSSQSFHNLSDHEYPQTQQLQQQLGSQSQSPPLSYAVKLQQQHSQFSQQQSQSASNSSIPVSMQQLHRNSTFDSFYDRNRSTCSTLSPCSFPIPNNQSSYGQSNKLEFLHLSSAAESSASPIPQQPFVPSQSSSQQYLQAAINNKPLFLDPNNSISNNNEEFSMMQGMSSLSLSEEPSMTAVQSESPQTQEGSSSPVIYIKNVNIEELKPENIYNIFRNFGYVHSILFMKENATILIQYEEPAQAKMAINQLNNVYFIGAEPLRISFAKRKAIQIPQNIFQESSNIPSNFMQQQQQSQQHSAMHHPQILSNLQMNSNHNVKKILTVTQNGSEYFLNKNNDPRSRVSSQNTKKNSFYNPASRTVYVTNIPIQLVAQNKQDFLQLFSTYGAIAKSSISISDMRVTALIEFDTLQTALKSICFLHNASYYGKLIQVFFTRTSLK